MLARTTSGTRIRSHAELDSTNVEAMRLAAAGERGPLWITADVQTHGKGRSGRAWIGGADNLHASYVFTTQAPVVAAHQLSLVAGVAVYDAVSTLGLGRDRGLRLKWPNDLLISAAKAGGILVESTAIPGRGELTAVIGIGLNLADHPAIDGRQLTSLAALGCSATPSAALDALDGALRDALQTWDASRGFAVVREAWLARAGALGERLTVHGSAGVIAGAFAGLDRDGALLIDLEGGERRRCTYGDVSLT